MRIKDKTVIFSIICLIGASVFLINESLINQKVSEIFQESTIITAEQNLINANNDINSALESKSEEECTRVIEAVVSNLETGVYEEATLVPIASIEPASETIIDPTINPTEEPAKKEYIVNGINYMDYIDFTKYENFGIVKIDNNSENQNLNVRSGAGANFDIVGKMTPDSGGKVIGQETGSDGKVWYKIESGEITGFVYGDYLIIGEEAQELIPQTGELVITANCDGLNLRKEPSLDESVAVLTTISEGEKVEVISILDEWIEVSYDTSGDNGTTAYVYKELVTISFEIQSAFKIMNYSGVVDTNAPLRQQIVSYAQNFLGNPYVWGGTSLTNGADCSGFTMSVFAKFGISLTHSSAAQANEGRSIAFADVQPGDLVFYQSPISHVAIYIGDGKIIHAANKKSGIKINNMYYTTPTKVVNVID